MILPVPTQADAAPLALPLAPWVAVGISYLLGALPFGLILARILKGVDLRQVGSGNIGATNVMRALGRGWGVVAFVMDFGKGYLPVALLAGWAAQGEELPPLRLACGVAAVLGHCFPLYLRFRGGKGVATGCGAIVAVDPLVFVAGGLVWLVSLGLTRFVGLSSMLMGTSFPLVAWWRQVGQPTMDRPFVLGCGLLAALIFVRHKKNIGRMLEGTEPRIGRHKPETSNG